MNVAAKYIVTGMVQGVGYRYFAYREAQALGLKGFVRNRYDGKVEGEVEGEEGLVKEFIKKLHIGPRSANVTGIDVDWQPFAGTYKSFEILH